MAKRKGRKWDAVFFDFDGVILDSVGVKTEAFAKLFRPYGPKVEKAVVAYHLAHGGVSRYMKFCYALEELLGEPAGEARLESLGRAFSDLVRQGVLEAPIVDGVMASLEMLQCQGIPAFVVSGTPEDELKQVVEERGLASFFEEVHGSPRTKCDIIESLLMSYGLTPSRCLMVGDAMTDYLAARKTQLHFLGIVSSKSSSPFPKRTKVSTSVAL